MRKFKGINLSSDAKEFFSSVIILVCYLALVFTSAFISPKNVYAACSISNSHRCDAPCYCPVPGNPLANPDYCKYCANNDQCNACGGPPPQEPPPGSECDKLPSIPEKAVCYAKSQLGDSYLLYAPPLPYDQFPPPKGADTYDCWGLVTWSYYWAGVKNLPKNTGPSSSIEVSGPPKLGDILYWNDKFCNYLAGAHAALSLGGTSLIQEGGDYPNVHYSTFFDIGMCPPDRIFRPY